MYMLGSGQRHTLGTYSTVNGDVRGHWENPNHLTRMSTLALPSRRNVRSRILPSCQNMILKIPFLKAFFRKCLYLRTE